MGCSPWDRKESDMTEQLTLSPFLGLGDLAPAGPRVECTHASHTPWIHTPGPCIHPTHKRENMLCPQK